MTRTAFGVFRLQPPHRGHFHIMNKMASDCENVIIGIGSVNQPISLSNLWSFEDRKKMVQNVIGNRAKIVPLADLGTDDSTSDWCDYVLDKLAKLGLPEPTDFYSGTETDGQWYKNEFFHEEYAAHYDKTGLLPPEGNVMHIFKREFITTSGTEVRKMLRFADAGWKDHVPRVNHDLIEATFPKEFMVTED